MRKTNVLKGLVCGLLFTAVAGSAVLAGSGNYTEFVGINGTGFKRFVGSEGVYQAELRGTRDDGDFRVSASSTATSTKRYVVQSARLGVETGATQDIDIECADVSRYKVTISAIGRVYMEEFSDYYGVVTVKNGVSDYSGICDSYTWELYPRANN